MLAALDLGRAARFGRLMAALAVGALPILIVAATAPAAAAAGCRPGSGPRLAGQRITAAEVARYRGTSGLECADLARANLSGLSLVQLDLTRANLRHAYLRHTDLGQATLSGAAMQGANLRSADLIQATMNRVSLVGADLRKAKLTQAELKGANLSKADLRYATLDEATLTHADLASANLTKASLIDVEAQGTNFRGANLTDADLNGATLTGAHFNGAKLHGASFSGVTGGPVPTVPGTGPKVSVTKKTLQQYLLGGAALIFVLMSLGSVRRYFYTRTGNFLGAPGAGYGAFGGPSNYGGSPWGGNDASGYGGQPTPTTSFTPTRANPYGPMPTAFTGRWRGAGRPAKLALAILGALVVAIALWLIGTTVADSLLVPAGNVGYRLCESTCGSRFASHSPVGLVAGVILLAFGGTLRAIGRIRY
jgi:uncharacterized protein YjbI with pentapeptide repeats